MSAHKILGSCPLLLINPKFVITCHDTIILHLDSSDKSDSFGESCTEVSGSVQVVIAFLFTFRLTVLL